MKKTRIMKIFLEQLRKTPIVQIACDKAGVSRNSIYRWRRENEQFRKAWNEAIAEGELLVNDIGESQLITMIREKNWSAISFWLRHHHPKYADKLLINAVVNNQDESLTPEQEALVREALHLAHISQQPAINPQKENELPKSDSTGTSGDNDKGQESPSGNN